MNYYFQNNSLALVLLVILLLQNYQSGPQPLLEALQH